MWALENTKYYTLGNVGLMVATDHKPLLRVLGDRKLEDIQNPRLLRIKEATLCWRFGFIHVPRKTHFGPNSLSRQGEDSRDPVTAAMCIMDPYREDPGGEEVQRGLEVEDAVRQLAAAVTPDPLSWGAVREAGLKDATTQGLLRQIRDGFPPDRKILTEAVRPYWRHRDELFEADGVAMFKERIVVPLPLRKVVLETLHAVHQGVRGMQLQAEGSV